MRRATFDDRYYPTSDNVGHSRLPFSQACNELRQLDMQNDTQTIGRSHAGRSMTGDALFLWNATARRHSQCQIASHKSSQGARASPKLSTSFRGYLETIENKLCFRSWFYGVRAMDGRGNGVCFDFSAFTPHAKLPNNVYKQQGSLKGFIRRPSNLVESSARSSAKLLPILDAEPRIN